jgi:hypothetical protein
MRSHPTQRPSYGPNGEPAPAPAFLQKRPYPIRYLHGAAVHYCTRDTICTNNPEVSRLCHRAVLGAPVRDGAAPADIARPRRPTESHNDLPTGPTSIVGQPRNPERRPGALRWLLTRGPRWRTNLYSGMPVPRKLEASEPVEVTWEQKRLTLKLSARPVEAWRDR